MPAVRKATQSDAESGELLGICREDSEASEATELGEVKGTIVGVARVFRSSNGFARALLGMEIMLSRFKGLMCEGPMERCSSKGELLMR